MTASVVSQPAESQPDGGGGIRRTVAFALIGWLLLVVAFGAAGAFLSPPGTPPVPIAIGVAAPLMLFFASLRLSRSFREFVSSLDLRLIAGMQAWRWAGLEFLSLYAHKVLPAVFALPAGLGDMAIGITAPWIILALVRRPGFAGSGTFIRWNVLGILDLVIAVGMAALSALSATGAPGEISVAPMATLPLLLVPAFLVPLFLMLHTAALMQSRQLIRSGRAMVKRAGDDDELNAAALRETGTQPDRSAALGRGAHDAHVGVRCIVVGSASRAVS